ncbi:hypothetical protein EKD04_025675 [Chloroflexales bacterium ZM16-3]|nr:hypothetical protein [Chloroflexales bacterium ZM16-3]
MYRPYDEGRGVAVLVGGQNTGGLLNDVWEYNGAAWTNGTPAQPLVARSGHGAAYDPSRAVVVVVGGMDAAGVRGDTWEWNGTFWRERVATAPLSARTHMALAYDAARGELVAFGGEDATGTIFADTQLHQASGSLSLPAPVATISRITPRDARQGVDTITFAGRGADADATDAILAYRWTHNGTLLSDQPTFTLPASALPLGEQVVRFAVQDNEGDWSPPIAQSIYIRDGNAGISTGTKTWTLLIYAVADNNLAPYMGDSATFSGMLYRLRSAGVQANVQVGLLYDGPTVNDTRRYILQADGQWRTETLPEARMDEMETLRDFVRWGYATFQSDYYALSLVDHANGVVGFGQDNTSDSAGKAFLTPIELRTALQQATDDGAHKLDVLHVDGCSFGLLEDAAIAADLAQYMVVSPNTGWGVFAYDRYRQVAGRAADPRTYAHDLAQTYAVAVGAWGRPYTVSVLDLAHFAAINRRVSDLGDQLLAYTNANPPVRVGQLRGLRAASQKYDSGGVYLEIDPEDSYVDLVDFATQVRASVGDADVQRAAGAVIDGVAPFVIYESHASGQFVDYDPFQGRDRSFTVTLDHATGLAIFYPPRSSTNTASAYMAYVQHRLFATTRDSGWARFLAQGLPPQLSGDPSSMPDDVLIPPLTQGGHQPTPTATPTATPPADSSPITGEITTMGGALSSSDGRFRISFPADAVAEDVIVTYTELSAPTHALPAGQRALRSFTLTAETRTGQVVTHFSQPYTLVLRYTDAMLADLRETNLSLVFGDGAAWVPAFPCPRCSQNTAANHISVELDHFTAFVLIGDARQQVFLPVVVR